MPSAVLGKSMDMNPDMSHMRINVWMQIIFFFLLILLMRASKADQEDTDTCLTRFHS